MPQCWRTVGIFRSDTCPLADDYQSYTFEFTNPRQQALTFIVDYGGGGGLRVDKIVVSPGQ